MIHGCEKEFAIGRAAPGHSYSFGLVNAPQARGDLEVVVERARSPHRGAIAFAMTASEDDGMRLTFRNTDIGMSRKSALRLKYFSKSTMPSSDEVMALDYKKQAWFRHDGRSPTAGGADHLEGARG